MQIDMLRPGLLGSYDQFGERYCTGKVSVAPGKLDWRYVSRPSLQTLPARWLTRQQLVCGRCLYLWQCCKGSYCEHCSELLLRPLPNHVVHHTFLLCLSDAMG